MIQPATKNARIYSEAIQYLGVVELDGPKTNPLIRSWILQSAKWLDQDDSKTAWCGCFRGAIGIATATGAPENHFRAASWRHWGIAVDKLENAIKGDTLIFTRRGGFHVGLYAGLSANGNPLVLGGNQSDSVSIAEYDKDHLLSIRR
jgi:uncharacterized protein (TIGR02594 family)